MNSLPNLVAPPSLCPWAPLLGPLYLAGWWGKREKEENHSAGFFLVTPAGGTHRFPSHGLELSYMVTQTAREAEENVLAVCPGEKGNMSTDVYHFVFAEKLMWSKFKSLPWTHRTSCQSAGTTLWNPHCNSSRRWEWPELSHAPLPSFLSFLCALWVGVVGFLSLAWFVDSFRRTLWWCGSNQITPFALAGGLLYCFSPGKTCYQQGPLATGKDAKGFPLNFSRLWELKCM